MYFYFYYLVIKKLSHEFYLFMIALVDICNKIFEIFESKVFFDYYFAEEEDYKIPLIQFLLFIIGDSLAFIGFLVYFEIIELNFCNLNYNLRRIIIERSIEDANQRTSFNDDQNESLVEDEILFRSSELSTKL